MDTVEVGVHIEALLGPISTQPRQGLAVGTAPRVSSPPVYSFLGVAETDTGRCLCLFYWLFFFNGAKTLVVAAGWEACLESEYKPIHS